MRLGVGVRRDAKGMGVGERELWAPGWVCSPGSRGPRTECGVMGSLRVSGVGWRHVGV